jgi:hypothetical protein
MALRAYSKKAFKTEVLKWGGVWYFGVIAVSGYGHLSACWKVCTERSIWRYEVEDVQRCWKAWLLDHEFGLYLREG